MMTNGLGTSLGRIEIELYSDLPKTSENFRQFCTGEVKEYGKPIGYKGSKFHRVVKGFMVQGGDFIKNNGTGRKTIYGSNTFNDEKFKYDHIKYNVSMANSGPNSNGCQFFICCKNLPHLDGKHVVFGKVILGFDVVDYIEQVRVDGRSSPKEDVIIAECGEM